MTPSDGKNDTLISGRSGGVLDSLDLYARLLSGGESSIGDDERIELFLAGVRDDLRVATQRASTIHGWRAQRLFEQIAVSLGGVQLVKQEDAGSLAYRGEQVRPPDFHLVLNDGHNLLVEVKNFHPRRSNSSFQIRRADLEALRRYSDLMGIDFRLAIHWARWNAWTLNAPSALRAAGEKLTIDFGDAMMTNEMYRVGDLFLGTQVPLELRLLSDPEAPRSINKVGECVFTIGGVEYRAGGQLIFDRGEQRLAFALMSWGGWHESVEAQIEDDLVEAVRFIYAPFNPDANDSIPDEITARDDNSEFALHASLSSIHSTIFRRFTSDEQGRPTSFGLSDQVDALKHFAPPFGDGTGLKLWRLVAQPARAESASLDD